ncbi:MAG: 2Fe-2S iron-sulfur cluster binding domain-containing protein [Treponema sp.]|jgi:ferredoxin-NADP reductase|nr:2Fe-2S iron-sulfur cluster binding domain-containing protein [Treponema sp.]
MAKKAKLSVNGYLADLLGWFKLPKQRNDWINGGSPKLEAVDPIAELAGKLHSGLIPARIIGIKEELSPARTYTLEPEEGRLPLHYAGQYLCLKFDINGRKMSRPFSISSPPQLSYRDNRVQFTIKKQPENEAYSYILDTWKEGQRLAVELPFGNFYYNKIRDAAHVVGIAGGSGVIPFRSIITDMPVSHRPERLTLLYASRTVDDILFKDELEKLAAESGGRIRIVHVLSEADTSGIGEKGIVNAELIKKLIQDYKDVSFYVCGSATFYDAVKEELDSLDIPSNRRRIAAYGGGGPVESHPEFPKGQNDKMYTLTVLFGQDRKEINVKSSETVAAALEKAGLAVDTRCGRGECGWCRSKLEAGSVWQRPEDLGVRARDKDTGYFHPCSAYPVSDLAIRVFSRL